MIIDKNKIIRLLEIPSTSDYAKEIALQSPEGTVVVAKKQSAGRGKPGNSWFSPSGSGLYFSVILKPYKNPPDLIPLTQLSSQAVIEMLFSLFKIKAEIKLPNDVLVNGKKIAGILTEKIAGAVIVGMGINVNIAQFPAELQQSVTSIKLETQTEANLELVFYKVLELFDFAYLKFLKSRL